jgi:hypothetical protein
MSSAMHESFAFAWIIVQMGFVKIGRDSLYEEFESTACPALKWVELGARQPQSRR